MSSESTATRQAMARLQGNGTTHVVGGDTPSGVDAFAVDGNNVPNQQPASPDLNADGAAAQDAQFYQELEAKYVTGNTSQNQQPQPQPTSDDGLQSIVQSAAQLGEQVQSIQDALLNGGSQEQLSPQSSEAPAEAPQEEAPPTSPTEPAIGFEKFEQEFQTKYGVSLGQAVEAASNIQATYEAVRQMASELAVQQQRMQLAQGWGVSFAEADSRIQQASTVYRQLTPDAQAKLGNDPVAATMRLHQMLNAGAANGNQQVNPVSQVPTAGRATIAENVQQGVTPELLSIQDDDQFYKALGQMYIPQ